MVNALLLLGVLSTTREPASPGVKIACLPEVVREVFPDPRYQINYVQNLEFAPVVYELASPVGTKKDLRGMCDALFLNCEIDEARHTVKISKGPRLTENLREKKIEEYLTFLDTFLKPYWVVKPKEVRRLAKTMSASLQDLDIRKPEDAAHYEVTMRKVEALGLLLSYNTRAVLASIWAQRPRAAKVLSEPYTSSNHLDLSPDALQVLESLYAGKDLDIYSDSESEDVAEKLTSTGMSRDKWQEIKAGDPRPVLSHYCGGDWMQLEVKHILPAGEFSTSSVNFELDSSVPRSNHDAIWKAFSPAPLQWKPIWGTDSRAFSRRPYYQRSTNSVGFLAKGLKSHYVSWLSRSSVWLEQVEPLEKEIAANPSLDFHWKNGWLSSFNPAEILYFTSPSWKHFLALRDLLDRPGDALAEILKYLDSLSQRDLQGLEDLAAEYPYFPQRYKCISGGVRAYKLALPYIIAAPAGQNLVRRIPYSDLPPGARQDYFNFFESTYIWNEYPHYLHPTNRSRLSQGGIEIERYVVETETQRNGVSVIFPKSWKPYAEGFGTKFFFTD